MGQFAKAENTDVFSQNVTNLIEERELVWPNIPPFLDQQLSSAGDLKRSFFFMFVFRG